MVRLCGVISVVVRLCGRGTGVSLSLVFCGMSGVWDVCTLRRVGELFVCKYVRRGMAVQMWHLFLVCFDWRGWVVGVAGVFEVGVGYL